MTTRHYFAKFLSFSKSLTRPLDVSFYLPDVINLTLVVAPDKNWHLNIRRKCTKWAKKKKPKHHNDSLLLIYTLEYDLIRETMRRRKSVSKVVDAVWHWTHGNLQQPEIYKHLETKRNIWKSRIVRKSTCRLTEANRTEPLQVPLSYTHSFVKHRKS